MSEKKMTIKDQDAIIALQTMGMSLEDAIFNVGYEKGRRGPEWVKGAPKEQRQSFGKVQSTLHDDKVYMAVIYPIADSDHWWVVGKDFKFSVHKDKVIAHIDEAPEKEGISNDAHEKEVMMKAFDQVRKIFELRSWIMDGRGSYPYNDDGYKEEVRYMYNEFDRVVKDTWANIKSHSYDYRKAIIEEYLKEEGNKGREVVFAEWIRVQNYKPYAGSWYLNGNNYAHQPMSTRNLFELFKTQKEK